jgi:putative aminopeptidase FrvX
MEKNIKTIIERTNEFLKIPSSICYEKPFLDFLNQRAKAFGYETILEDRYLVIRPKVKSTILFSAHIDRHALIKNEQNEIEYLAFYLKKKRGDQFLHEKHEEIEEEFTSSINKEYQHAEISLEEDFILVKQKNKPNLKFDRKGRKTFFESVGLRHTKEDISSYDSNTGEILNHYRTLRNSVSVDEKKVIYDTNMPLKEEDKIFMFNSKAEEIGNLVSGQIDNVISAACIFELIEKKELQQEVIFTTEEEIGTSWECIKDYSEKHNSKLKLIVLDTSPYTTLENFHLGYLTLREGDERADFDLELVSSIKKIVDEEKIPTHYKPSFIGNTELGKVVLETEGKLTGVTLQLPTTNYHTTYETCTKESLKNYMKIIEKLNHF